MCKLFSISVQFTYYTNLLLLALNLPKTVNKRTVTCDRDSHRSRPRRFGHYAFSACYEIMLQICRAEDGSIIQTNAGVRDIERIGSVELFIHQETGIDQDAVIAYLPDGKRLTNSNLRELNGSQTQSIFVFNKYYLDLNMDEVLRELRYQAPMAPPIEDAISATPPFRPSQVAASYHRTATTHMNHVTHILATLHCQHDALRVALTSLDMHVLAVTETSEGVSASAQVELDKQTVLLAGLEADLDIIGRVRVHTEFVSLAVRKAIEAGEKPRTLGDYVSDKRMRQVGNTCLRTHEDLQEMFRQTKQAVSHLRKGADGVRVLVMAVSLLDESELCAQRSQDLVEKISRGALALEGHVPDPDGVLQELRQHDFSLRQELQYMANIKNSYTQYCIGALRTISMLNNDMVQIPPMLAALQTSFRGRNSFSHIQRLHSMLYAYGATVIEIVRRKEFARFFYQRAQSILEVMAKLSATEKKRRQMHRGEVHGQLPFETKGMNDPVPTIDFSPSGSLDATYSLEREDIDGLFNILDDIENACSDDAVALAAVRESRAGLHKLVVKMDSLEAGFDRIAERSLLSASRLSSSRRRSTEADEQAFQEMSQQIREAQEFRMHQEAVHREERLGLQGQIHQLHQGRESLERELTEERLVSDSLRHELSTIRADLDDAKALDARNSEKMAALLAEQAANLQTLEEARSRGEDLEGQIQAEREKVEQALSEAGREKDRLLRAQATEHDRIIRDHLAEADGDRAVLERQFHELKAVQERTQRELDAAREEIKFSEREAREAKHAERMLRDDLRAGRASQSDYEQRLEDSGRLVAQMLDVALAFRDSHLKALHATHLMASHPGRSSLGESISVFSTQPMLDEPPPIDPSDPSAALDALRAFDHDHFVESVSKTGGVIRKWQKQCKEYRERAKGKISFRNFAKGDLALFLPTRNSVLKPWAAFNVSFPHYFLQATGHLSDQLKTREWIVARITSITERVVDHHDPTSNPYGLGDGVKYYMLEVEDWTQQQPQRRKGSSRRESAGQPTSLLLSSDGSPPARLTGLPSGPPEAQVEDTFTQTHVFPRTSSSPPVRPSSLSRLLAQAPPSSTSPPDAVEPGDGPSSPQTSPPPPSSPSLPGSHPKATIQAQSSASPLRPASRLSNASRFSVGIVGSSAKAAPTTALAGEVLSSSPDAADTNAFTTPSPVESVTDGIANLVRDPRHRKISYQVPRSSPLAPSTSHEMTVRSSSNSAFANLANSWGVAFGRKKKMESEEDAGEQQPMSAASDLLKRF
ncbi:unnamed protein product [Mycena citricolor]|uniref:Autophagy-related protein 11 n=2 Tax=Mycena citricolor TaxID=2018698 RepID=A0AAD2HVZ5_9AGAR|nr:unnamed protein product [Mycena citricolor]